MPAYKWAVYPTTKGTPLAKPTWMPLPDDWLHPPKRAARLSPAPPMPANESKRLEALRRYQVSSTSPEPAFDRVTRLASKVFRVPIVRMALFDEHRQWIKSRIGPALEDARREFSFCTHALLADKTVVVPDTLKDPRFRDHPHVQGPPSLRFYAGALVRSDDGFALGTLCVIDTKPRPFGAEEVATLTDLADVLSDLLSPHLMTSVAADPPPDK
jgi:GAF domain-containing protein